MTEYNQRKAGWQQQEPQLIGTSGYFQQTLQKARRLTRQSGSVLILGEDGSGKRTLGYYMHSQGPKASMPFIYISCRFAQEFCDSNRADEDLPEPPNKPNAFISIVEKSLDIGEVFLDEIAELSYHNQSQLLQFLNGKAGASTSQWRNTDSVSTMLCSSKQSLIPLVQKGSFRRDLYYLLSGRILQVPPLRHRTEDIPLLAEYWLQQFGYGHLRFHQKTMWDLADYSWPGNIDELRNCIHRVASSHQSIELGQIILPSHVAPYLNGSLLEENIAERKPDHAEHFSRFEILKKRFESEEIFTHELTKERP